MNIQDLTLENQEVINIGDTILIKTMEQLLKYSNGMVTDWQRNIFENSETFIETPQQWFNVKNKDICGKKYKVTDITSDRRMEIRPKGKEYCLYVPIYWVNKKVK